MNIVILSGGSGKRLWPLSNDTQSKQFLRLLKNADGEYESMVERVMRQIREVHPGANVIISCYAPQEEVLRRQLGAVEIISEPERRDTFPAIALAASYLRYKRNLDDNETFIVCPIDIFAENKFFELLSGAKSIVEKGRNSIGLIGAIPLHPTEKYGYILQKGGVVSGFVEKPTEEVAERLIGSGALWNSGVYAMKIGYVMEHTKKHVAFNSFESLYSQYAKLPKISFDFEVTENERSMGVVTYGGTWKDLGTWNTLTEEMSGKTVGGNVYMSESCQDTHVLNMLSIPVIAHDLTDCVVVASHDGILVSSKPGSANIKPLADQIDIGPMYEQRQWGNYRILDNMQSGETPSVVRRTHIDAGHTLQWQVSSGESAAIIIISGSGTLTIDEQKSGISEGNVIQIQQQSSCSLHAATDIELIEVQLGSSNRQ